MTTIVEAPSLFSLAPVGRARARDPETSRAAARAQAGRLPSLRSRIRDAFRTYGALTDDELCQALGMPPRRWPSVKTARSALTGAEELVWSGTVRNGQRVWKENMFTRIETVVVTNERL